MSLEDPRQRTRTFLLTYMDSSAYPAMGNIYFNDGETPATYACMYTKPNIPLKLLYYGNKNYDIIFLIGEPDNTPIRDWQHKTIGYQENVPITLCAIDKDGLTAQLALWQAELKLRKIVETYFAGTLRTLRRTKPNQQYLGGFFEYNVECEIGYLRSTDTVPTYPTITYGDNQASTFTFPNVTDISYNDPDSGDAYLLPPGRIGEITQILGMENFEVTLTCNLDINPTGLTWKRPQTTTPKTDVMPEQVFREIKFMGKTDSDQTYQNLNLGYGAVIPVRVTDIDLEKSGAGCVLRVTFKRYSATDGSAGTYNAWYGIST